MQKNEEEIPELNIQTIQDYLKTIEISIAKTIWYKFTKELTFTFGIGYKLYYNGKIVFTTKSSKTAIDKYKKLE